MEERLNVYQMGVLVIKSLPPRFRGWAAIGFAEDGGDPASPRGQAHLKYIKDNCRSLMASAFEHPALLHLMCREGLITAKNMDAFIARSKDTGDVEIQSLLLDYMSTHIGMVKMEAYRERRADKRDKDEMTILQRTIVRKSRNGIHGLRFVVSGRYLYPFFDQTAVHSYLNKHGATLVQTVSPSVDYVISNDMRPTSKTRKAKQLGIRIINTNQLNVMAAQIADNHK